MTISDLWNNADNKSFYIELNNKKYFKRQIEKQIEALISNLNEISYFKDRKVFIDIKDRFLFIIVFFSLVKLNSKIVLVPVEAKIEDYYYNKAVVISDNKKSEQSIFMSPDMRITEGSNFDPESPDSSEHNDTVLYLYTSGSTGKAKLIPKSNANIFCEVEELYRIFKIKNEDKFYFTPPMYHIYGILFDLFLPLYASCGIVLDYLFTPDSIAEIVIKKKVTHFISIPSYYRMFEELGLTGKFKKCAALFSSSAPLPLDVSEKFYGNEIKITEIYGSTETGGIAYRTSAVSQDWKLFSYIKIIEDWPQYDREGTKELVEFKITSPSISVSYDINTGFNTGDIVDIYPENKFRLLGRNTRFVKISGKRVDLNFIFEKIRVYFESVLKKDVNEEFIYIGEKGEKIFCIFENEFPKSSKEIKDDLKKILPGYSVPRYFIFEKIPKNIMGKIDKVKIEEMISKIEFK